LGPSNAQYGSYSNKIAYIADGLVTMFLFGNSSLYACGPIILV